jgi:hypothetical protein
LSFGRCLSVSIHRSPHTRNWVESYKKKKITKKKTK